jgi:hypothetical protein
MGDIRAGEGSTEDRRAAVNLLDQAYNKNITPSAATATTRAPRTTLVMVRLPSSVFVLHGAHIST